MPSSDDALLQVSNLNVNIKTLNGTLHAVRGVDFSVRRGETLCLVGESGCGKSVTAMTLMGLLGKNASVTADTMQFGDRSLLGLGRTDWEALRGDRIGMIFQDPMTALNPVLSIGYQMTEIYLRHRGGSRQAARERAIHLMEKVGITAAAKRMKQFPHQLSGGLRQRVMIAMTLMCEPLLLIADEPTTALDVTIQAQILKLLSNIQKEFQIAMILITHDLGIVSRVADRVAVMYAGSIVETGTPNELFNHPAHPYTQGLMGCVLGSTQRKRGEPLQTIPGVVPSLYGELKGCSFRGRCPVAMAECEQQSPPCRTVGEAHLSFCHRALAQSTAEQV